MLTQTRDVSTSFVVISEKPDKMGHYLFVTPATTRTYCPWDPLFMYLFCLGEFEHLAEGWDKVKIVVAITASGCLYMMKSASSHS
jgi:hypothetical protein